MTKMTQDVKIRPIDALFDGPDDAKSAIPIYLATESNTASWQDDLSEPAKQWLKSTDFQPKPGRIALVPTAEGNVSSVVFGLRSPSTDDDATPAELTVGKLARQLPPGRYQLAKSAFDHDLAAIAWGLGGYKFTPYKTSASEDDQTPRLCLPDDGINTIKTTVEGVWFGRDLINTPASDLGPEELQAAARAVAERHDARLSVIVGEALLEKNFPLIHAVGRASPREPRLIELNWEPKDQPTQTRQSVCLVGKGICFDTGGLDLKPSANMILMKKDMGGAATVLALAHMIMGQNLNIALRVLIPAAENSVAGNAFRPSDIITSRSGKTVEIGNTDAEGRLVLADALSYADEDKPDTMITCATLTGAARVALGADLPAVFSTDDNLANRLHKSGLAIGDPSWRMPFWQGYTELIKSPVADMNNIGTSPLGGAIIAALFLKSFVQKTKRYMHVDLYGWCPSDRPDCPKGGNPQTARALCQALMQGLDT